MEVVGVLTAYSYVPGTKLSVHGWEEAVEVERCAVSARVSGFADFKRSQKNTIKTCKDCLLVVQEIVSTRAGCVL